MNGLMKNTKTFVVARKLEGSFIVTAKDNEAPYQAASWKECQT